MNEILSGVAGALLVGIVWAACTTFAVSPMEHLRHEYCNLLDRRRLGLSKRRLPAAGRRTRSAGSRRGLSGRTASAVPVAGPKAAATADFDRSLRFR